MIIIDSLHTNKWQVGPQLTYDIMSIVTRWVEGVNSRKKKIARLGVAKIPWKSESRLADQMNAYRIDRKSDFTAWREWILDCCCQIDCNCQVDILFDRNRKRNDATGVTKRS